MLRAMIAVLILVPQLVFAAATRVTIDPAASEIQWKGSKEMVNDFHAGTVKIKEGFLTLEGEKVTGGEIVVDMTSIKNTDLKDPKMAEKLVGHLNSPDFFDVANHKEARFTITKVSALPGGEQVFEGDLTIRGKKNAEKITASLKKEGKVWVAAGKTEIDRTKYDVKYNSKDHFPNLIKTAKDKVIKNNIALDFKLKTK